MSFIPCMYWEMNFNFSSKFQKSKRIQLTYLRYLPSMGEVFSPISIWSEETWSLSSSLSLNNLRKNKIIFYFKEQQYSIHMKIIHAWSHNSITKHNISFIYSWLMGGYDNLWSSWKEIHRSSIEFPHKLSSRSSSSSIVPTSMTGVNLT